MTVEKPKPKQLLRPITTGADSAMNQSQFLAITCNSLEAREKSRVHVVIGFGFASHWLKNWRESFRPITKLSNRNHVITFDSHLKTALKENDDKKGQKARKPTRNHKAFKRWVPTESSISWTLFSILFNYKFSCGKALKSNRTTIVGYCWEGEAGAPGE